MSHGPLPRLQVVTAASRPENLRFLFQDLVKLRDWLDVQWIILYAPGIAALHADEPWIRHELECETGVGGYPQKNRGLELCQPGWVYFLDDDNGILPCFGLFIRGCLIAFPDARGFVFDQMHPDGTLRLRADPERCVVGNVDQGQVLLHTDVINQIRHPVGDYAADGHFIVQVRESSPEKLRFINLPATGFNLLR